MRLVLLLAIFLVVLGFTTADIVLTITRALQPLNRTLTFWFYQFDPRWLSLPMIGFTLLGDDPPLDLFALAVAVWAFRRRHRRDAVLMLGVAVAARIIGALLKLAVHQSRPNIFPPPWPLPALHGYGYPSGHAVLSSAILGFGALIIAALLKHRAARWAVVVAAILLVLCIGWSRIYLGFHWVNDVIGGYLWGALAAVGGAALRVHEQQRGGTSNGRSGVKLVEPPGRSLGEGAEPPPQ